jgi:hypothetical protein
MSSEVAPDLPDTGLLVILSQEGFKNAVEACLAAGYPADEVNDRGLIGMLSPGKEGFEPRLQLTGRADFMELRDEGSLYFEHHSVGGAVRAFSLMIDDVLAIHRTGI